MLGHNLRIPAVGRAEFEASVAFSMGSKLKLTFTDADLETFFYPRHRALPEIDSDFQLVQFACRSLQPDEDGLLYAESLQNSTCFFFV